MFVEKQFVRDVAEMGSLEPDLNSNVYTEQREMKG